MKLYRKVAWFILTILLTSLLSLSLPQVNATTLDYLPEQAELFKQALTAAKITPEDVHFDRADMSLWSGDKYRIKLLDVFFDNPWKISEYTRTLSKNLLAVRDNLAELTSSTYRMIDKAGISPQLKGDLLVKYQKQVEKLGDDALLASLSKLTGESIDRFKTSPNLPPKLRSAVAEFLFAIADALHYRELGLQRSLTKLQLDPEKTYTDVLNYVVNIVGQEETAETPEQLLLLESLLDNINFNLLNTGGIIAVAATQALQKELSQLPLSLLQADYNYNIDTPQGRILLRGQGNQVYPPDNYLLIVDASGDDTYAGGAGTQNMAHGTSVILDLAGNDHYVNSFEKVPSFGAGVFGYGILMDIKGNDVYSAQYASQGIGIFGTGILYDAQGTDTYTGIDNLQGTGSFGTGLLVDNQGSDRYSMYGYGQGFGSTKGLGLLLDSSGNDQYIGLEDKYPNGGPFGTSRHVHFLQGAGYGRRADDIDGDSWAGGVGMLVDGAGNDRYSCDIFCQGTGYWYSLGFLVDKSGNDIHRAGAYSLGGTPHFSVGIYQDDAGSDRYQVRASQSLGKGRDWSIGWFEESGGNDFYLGSHGILGSADINGIGIFWDKQGDDNYVSFAELFATEAAYGQSKIEVTGLRELMLTLGLFVDGGGQDNYLFVPKDYKHGKYIDEDINPQIFITNSTVGNNQIWCHPTIPHDVKKAYGCGIDANSI